MNHLPLMGVILLAVVRVNLLPLPLYTVGVILLVVVRVNHLDL